MKRNKLFLAAVFVAIIGFSGIQASALTESETKTIHKAVQGVKVPELGPTAVKLILQAPEETRQETAVATVKAILLKHPAAAVTVVNTVSKASPEVSAAVAAVAVEMVPLEAAAIAKAAATAAPKHADKIAKAMSKAHPKSTVRVAHAVVTAVPTASAQVVESVSATAPQGDQAKLQAVQSAGERLLEQLRAQTSASQETITQEDGTIGGSNAGDRGAPTPINAVEGEDYARP